MHAAALVCMESILYSSIKEIYMEVTPMHIVYIIVTIAVIILYVYLYIIKKK